LAWMAPELVLGSGEVKRSADVYSYGRLLAFLATGISPLSEFPDDKLRDMLTDGPPPLPTWPQTCFFGPDCKELVHSCIRGKETDRPSMTQVHEELIGYPEALGLADAKGHLLMNARLVAAHYGKDSAGQGKEAKALSEFSTANAATAGSTLPIIPTQCQPSSSCSPPLTQPETHGTPSEGTDKKREVSSELPGQVESSAEKGCAAKNLTPG